jgi:ABC-2 type transport system permease protein
MNFNRVFAIIERDMRKFLRSPSLMMTSMVFPLLQLIVLGYAFGGKITNVKLALVDDDHTAESRLVREKLNSVAQGAKTFRVEGYGNLSDAI